MIVEMQMKIHAKGKTDRHIRRHANLAGCGFLAKKLNAKAVFAKSTFVSESDISFN